MNEIRINTKIPRLIDTRNHVCLPCDLLWACLAALRPQKSVAVSPLQQMLRKSRSATLSIA